MVAPDPNPAYIDLLRRTLSGLFFCLFMTGFAQAESLYSSQIQVLDQTEIARAGAVTAGLAEVLVRISGDSAITRHYAIGLILGQSTDYLSSYEYRTLPSEVGDGELIIQLNFEPEKIKAVLNDYQIPLWPESRPSTLLWLALQKQGDTRRLVGPGEPPASMVEQAAQRRGLPLLLPLLDLQDRVAVALADVWLDNPQPIQLASARYTPTNHVVTRVTQTSTGWQARWSLYQGGQVSRWSNQAGSLNLLLGQGVDELTDRVAEQYASDPTDFGSDYSLTLNGIKKFADYAQALRYIEQLESVITVQPQRLSGEQAVFQLQLRGDSTALARRVELDAVLRPLGDPLTWAPNTLQFQLKTGRLP